MKDALSFAGEKASRLVSSGYINMATHAPNLFRCLYAAGGLVSTSRSKSPVYWANVSYADALHRYILDKGFDTIITPHLFPAEALTHLLRKHGLAAVAMLLLLIIPASPSGRKQSCMGILFRIGISFRNL